MRPLNPAIISFNLRLNASACLLTGLGMRGWLLRPPIPVETIVDEVTAVDSVSSAIERLFTVAALHHGVVVGTRTAP
jgi:hypothetical protein